MNVSGLSPKRRVHARDMAAEAAVLALRNAPVVHYTQTARRWDGIAKHLKAWRGEFPHYADCSAFVTWCLWNGLDHYGVGDVVNHERWQAGFTGTMLEHGQKLDRPWDRGDAVIYGTGFPGEHTAIYIGGGLVISHGSEAGPFKLPVHYRPDVMAYRRYI
jgi:cell wall-associated NlpC family hydrolase